jgi:Schlafen, AlbA_2
MTREELSNLIAEIRAGRSEDDAMDWKRAFWDLKSDPSRREFIKDISAMATSMSIEEVRRIIVGVSSEGAIHGAVLPSDEANLQQVLAAIIPTPHVTFESHDIEGKSVIVVEIKPPFDRPHVGKLASDHYVWLRQGSRTVTASRYQLDQFYKRVSPKPNISVSWLDKGDAAVDILEVPALPEKDISTEVARLAALRPKPEDLARLEERQGFVENLIKQEGLEGLGLGRVSAKAEQVVRWPFRLAEDIDRLLVLAQDSPEEFVWASSLLDIAVDSPSVKIFNGGTKPATNIVTYLEPSSEVVFLSIAELYSRALSVGQARYEKAMKVVQLANRSSTSTSLISAFLKERDLELIGNTTFVNRPVEVSLEKGRVRININFQLKHNFRKAIKLEHIFICARLSQGAESKIAFECHADEQPDPSKGFLLIRAVEGNLKR